MGIFSRFSMKTKKYIKINKKRTEGRVSVLSNIKETDPWYRDYLERKTELEYLLQYRIKPNKEKEEMEELDYLNVEIGRVKARITVLMFDIVKQETELKSLVLELAETDLKVLTERRKELVLLHSKMKKKVLIEEQLESDINKFIKKKKKK